MDGEDPQDQWSSSLVVDGLEWQREKAQGKDISIGLLFCPQDTIEGVSDLGLIAELLRGEVLLAIQGMGATR